MAALFRVKALYEYTSPHEDDLTFDAGQVITVTEEEDEDWYGGEYTDANGAKQEGIFPRNFVEKIEPTAPPRPARARPKKDSAEAPKSPEAVAAPSPAVAAAPTQSEPAPVREPEPEPEPEVVEPEEPREKSPPPQPAAPVPAPAPRRSVDEPKPAPASVEKPKDPVTAAAPPPRAKAASPPPVSDKPLSNSFKDRIAAFNKPAAPPVAPFKPTGLSSGGGSGGGTGFIKKPFVAAPPSRDAYVPPPQQAPVSKIYRRDEDPEIREKEEENKEQAERAGLAPTEGTEGGDEDQPKPTTLKERIALLQKQQQEQAQRHADTAAKKEKPKKPPPPKKAEPAPVATEEPAEEEEGHHEVESGAPPALPRRSTEESARRSSTDDAGADVPPPPRRKASKAHALEPIHDGNEADMSGAGDTTEGQDDTTEREDEEPARQVPRPPMGMAQPPPQTGAEKREEEGEEEDEEDEDEDEDVDPEIKRKEELRARMAKMSGGMGFHGMFGMGPPPGGAPPSKKKAQTPKTEAPVEEAEEEPASPAAAPPVPAMIPVPGMGGPPAPPRRSGESTRSEAHEPEPTPTARAPPPVPARQVEDDEDEDDETTPALTPAASATHPPPPVPGGRPAPPPVPAESRPPPPPPPGNLQSPSEGSASGDEMPAVQDKSLDSAAAQPQPPQLPPMPPQPVQTADLPLRTPTSPGGEEPPLASPTATTSKRNSRPPPPIPGSAPAAPPSSSRPPPPPPPGPGGVSRQSTADIQIPPIPTPVRPPQAGEENESEATEYEGDYDTDIGSSVPHKDALKAHARDSSQDDNSFQSPTDAPSGGPPPIPQASAPKAVPPPVPSQPPPPPAESKRRSVDMPRAAPPPPPPTREPLSPSGQQEDYDPYNYSTTPGLSKKTPRIEEEAYFPDSQTSQSPPGRPAPQQMPSARSRQSLDVGRKSMSARRSMDAPRPTGESGFIAEDMELAVQSGWWKQANQVPPVLQGRRDIFYECDESTTTNQGAKTEITREIWILFQDYSQTILTIRYDPYDPTDVDIEQRHEPPPRPLRQDQMEDFYERFGRPISEAAASKKDSVVGDGTPQGFILELLRPHKDALPPVGTRAFGALVYSNMANASTSQNDAIRPGDIISIRNAKFQGKHGPMHAKYSVEVGKPDHVGVVAEWDGTKKKVRAWEQGRESKKVKMESFKLDDLRSGEVRIWRVMPRGWVGWNSQA